MKEGIGSTEYRTEERANNKRERAKINDDNADDDDADDDADDDDDDPRSSEAISNEADGATSSLEVHPICPSSKDCEAQGNR